MQNEIWKPVVGYEGSYEVSNLGNVRGLDRIKINAIGRKQHTLGRLLIKQSTYWGYHKVRLSMYDNGKSKAKGVFVHRLVADAFIHNPEKKPQVNHIDGDKTNNNVNNLEWNTQSENQNHAVKTGLKKVFAGENNHSSKLTMVQVREIRASYIKKYGAIAELARKYNVSGTAINYIIKNKTYAE